MGCVSVHRTQRNSGLEPRTFQPAVVTSLTVAINDSPLAARVHQSGANMNDPLAARVHQGEVDDAINPIWGASNRHNLINGLAI